MPVSNLGPASGKTLVVVTNHQGYQSKRNILSLPFENTRVERRFDVFKVFAHAHYRILGGSNVLQNLWFDVGQYKLVHLRDGISIGRSPWICSFQDFLPRWGVNTSRLVEWGLERIASKKCRALIAQSDAALRRQLHYAEMKNKKVVEIIERKLHMLHPPQAAIVENYGAKDFEKDVITFMLVGHAFFLKGGREMLRAFDRLLEQNAPIRLIIVSKLDYGDFASRTTEKDLEEAKRIISKHKHNIIHFAQLPHAQVLELFKTAHVGMLPSWSETYGYSVLEAQAAGCPVISTDINALSEINNEQVGWIVNVPKHSWKVHALWETDAQRASLSALIEESVYSVVEKILNDPSQIERKGVQALDRIRLQHNPVQYARKLESIYWKALSTEAAEQ